MSALTARFEGHLPWPPEASDEVQFFSADLPKGAATLGATHDYGPQESIEPRPLRVACVGISYNAYSHEIAGKVVPHVFTRTKGTTWASDEKRSHATRRALGVALSAYARNSDTWMANGYASAGDLLSLPPAGQGTSRSLVLIKTFLSPFLPTKPWAELSGGARKATFDAWNPNQHICDLISTLGESIDLWVMQGTPVWQHFITRSRYMTKWLLTPILSFESQRNGSIERFWQTPRKSEPLIEPFFPTC